MWYFKLAAFSAAVLALTCVSTSATAAAVPLQPLYDKQCSDIIHGQWLDFDQTLAPEYVALSLDAPPVSYASQAESLRTLTQLLGANNCTVRIVKMTQGPTILAGQVMTATLYFTLSGILPKAIHHMDRGDHVIITYHAFDTWRISGATPVQTADVTLGLVVTRNGKNFIEEGQN